MDLIQGKQNLAHLWKPPQTEPVSLLLQAETALAVRNDHVEENEIIYISDEDVGICGGIITLATRKSTKDASFRVDWTALKPLPMFRPNVKAKPDNLRPIVIDGSNVSYYEGLYYGSRLDTCVRAFVQAGHEVKAFIPQFRLMHSSTREAEILDELEESGVLVLTPSRSVDFHRITPYDDRFMVEYANLNGAVIVSNDRFSDLLQENESWRETILRRLSFRWYDDRIYFPKYPLGDNGPTLSEFLHTHTRTV